MASQACGIFLESFVVKGRFCLPVRNSGSASLAASILFLFTVPVSRTQELIYDNDIEIGQSGIFS